MNQLALPVEEAPSEGEEAGAVYSADRLLSHARLASSR